MINLRDKDRQSLCQIADNCFNTAIEIWAYGSRVNGDSHDGSDLDLVIHTEGDGRLSYQELVDFKHQIQQSNIPILVQVMDWNKIPESFHKNILKKYEVIYAVK